MDCGFKRVPNSVRLYLVRQFFSRCPYIVLNCLECWVHQWEWSFKWGNPTSYSTTFSFLVDSLLLIQSDFCNTVLIFFVIRFEETKNKRHPSALIFLSTPSRTRQGYFAKLVQRFTDYGLTVPYLSLTASAWSRFHLITRRRRHWTLGGLIWTETIISSIHSFYITLLCLLSDLHRERHFSPVYLAARLGPPNCS